MYGADCRVLVDQEHACLEDVDVIYENDLMDMWAH